MPASPGGREEEKTEEKNSSRIRNGKIGRRNIELKN